MKDVVPDGSGNVGRVLRQEFAAQGNEVVVLSRGGREGTVDWDGETLGPWAGEMDGADVVISLAGRMVNCRYTRANLKEMMDSRVRSTRVIGEAIARARHPPKVWLQASAATIYAHRFDVPNDEATGIIGGKEPSAPPKWNASIAKAWEAEFDAAGTPATRKVALRSAIRWRVRE